MTLRVALVSCGKLKLASSAPAKDLYCSPLFKKTRAYVELHYDRWYILSALHQVVAPDQLLGPYNMRMPTRQRDKELWCSQTSDRLLSLLPPACRVDLFAGEDYCGIVGALEQAGHAIEQPLEGLAVGKRLKWLNEQLNCK